MAKNVFHYFSYATYFTKNSSKEAREKFYENFNYVKTKKNISSMLLYWDIISTSIRCDMSPLEYFKMRMFEKSRQEKEDFVSSRVLRKYQMLMNDAEAIDVMLDKIKFLTLFKDLAGRKWASYQMLKQDAQLIHSFLQTETGRVVLKNSRGAYGQEVKVVDIKGQAPEQLLKLMEDDKLDLMEEYVIQHDDLMKIAPNGLNTVRIVTQLHNGEPEIIGAALKLTAYSNVDNLIAGNFAHPVEIETGRVTGAGVYGDITRADVEVHPVTGINIMNFKVPHWNKCIETVKQGALLVPKVKSIGWDVAVTNTGALLIEGNNDWSNILWQLPARKGLKKDLLHFVEKL